jgi:hypothetical protein
MAGFRLQLMRSPLAVLAMVVNATFFCGQAKAVDTIVSGGIDSTSSVVANVNSDGSGGIFAVIVGSNYTGYSGDPSLSGLTLLRASVLVLEVSPRLSFPSAVIPLP